MSTKIDIPLKKKKNDWVEMFPYGVTISPDGSRPLMLFKDKQEKRVLPVWLSHLDAGIAIRENGMMSDLNESPYHITWKILDPLGIKLRKCFFMEIRGHHQFVELHFEGHPKLKTLECRADESVSFCMSRKAQFFCKPSFIDRCQVLESEMETVSDRVLHNPNILTKNHQYMN